MNPLSRRHFLRRAAATSLAFSTLGKLAACGDAASSSGGDPLDGFTGFGDLVPDPAGVMDLPEGFTYRILSEWQHPMDDGFLQQLASDGMAAFPGPDGTTVLVRNHELYTIPEATGPFGDGNRLLTGIDPARVYDYGFGTPALGDTTTLVYDTRAQRSSSSPATRRTRRRTASTSRCPRAPTQVSSCRCRSSRWDASTTRRSRCTRLRAASTGPRTAATACSTASCRACPVTSRPADACRRWWCATARRSTRATGKGRRSRSASAWRYAGSTSTSRSRRTTTCAIGERPGAPRCSRAARASRPGPTGSTSRAPREASGSPTCSTAQARCGATSRAPWKACRARTARTASPGRSSQWSGKTFAITGPWPMRRG